MIRTVLVLVLHAALKMFSVVDGWCGTAGGGGGNR